MHLNLMKKYIFECLNYYQELQRLYFNNNMQTKNKNISLHKIVKEMGKKIIFTQLHIMLTNYP